MQYKGRSRLLIPRKGHRVTFSFLPDLQSFEKSKVIALFSSHSIPPLNFLLIIISSMMLIFPVENCKPIIWTRISLWWILVHIFGDTDFFVNEKKLLLKTTFIIIIIHANSYSGLNIKYITRFLLQYYPILVRLNIAETMNVSFAYCSQFS